MRLPDVSLAIRNVFRRPGFAAVAIALLALGAGANAAVFSVVRSVLLRPLPYADSDRLVAFWPNAFVSNEELGYWRDRTRSFESIAAQSPGWMMGLVAEGGEPLKVTGGRVSDNLFRTLGASAALGRTIEPGESVAGRDRVAVLSDGLWRRRFAGDPNILGRTIQLDQQAHVVIGVMAPGFEVLQPGMDLWAPLPWDPSAANFKATFSQAVARLKPGVSIDVASQELRALVPAMRRDLVRANNWGQTIRVAPLQETVTGNVRPTILTSSHSACRPPRSTARSGRVAVPPAQRGSLSRVAGLPAAFALSRVMASVVFGISPRDPLTFAILPLAIVMVTLAACYLPARRAARVDPVVAIRTD